MFEHALKLVWNRRNANLLVVVEIGLAFAATFVVLALGVHYWVSYQRPLGFQYDDVWRVQLQTDRSVMQANDGWSVEDAHTLRNVLRAIREVPGVEAAHVIRVTPFARLRSNGPYLFEAGRIVGTSQNAMTSGALETLGVRVVDGRLFDQTDEGQGYRAAVVNQAYVEKAFGRGVSPLNRNINQLVEHPNVRSLDGVSPFFLREVKVVGVIANYRSSDLADEIPMVLTQYELEHAVENAVEHPNGLFVKVAPGTDASVEQRIIDAVKAVSSDWGVVVTRWKQIREHMHAQVLTPIIIGAIVAGFVLVMVALGLIGVVGLDIIRRTQEIGLRRAVGATAGGVQRQILLELLVTGLFGIACGSLIAIQIPLLRLIDVIDWAAAIPGLLLAAVLIVVLVLLSALYPSWLAARREPADALRYE
jgi:putative ABC transport system permease protein